jgi:DNA-binding CsgD family transcriptional regulator
MWMKGNYVDNGYELMLTHREREVLQLVAEGVKPTRISAALGISQHTVHSHLLNIRGKLHARDTAHAAALAWTKRLIR